MQPWWLGGRAVASRMKSLCAGGSNPGVSSNNLFISQLIYNYHKRQITQFFDNVKNKIKILNIINILIFYFYDHYMEWISWKIIYCVEEIQYSSLNFKNRRNYFMHVSRLIYILSYKIYIKHWFLYLSSKKGWPLMWTWR